VIGRSGDRKGTGIRRSGDLVIGEAHWHPAIGRLPDASSTCGRPIGSRDYPMQAPFAIA
jgi:hypothetical protein